MMLIWGGLKKEIKRLKQGFNSNLVRFGEGGMEKVEENFTSFYIIHLNKLQARFKLI